MRWRKISEDEVKDTVSIPDLIADSIKGRKNAFKNVGGKRLKVTFIENSDTITVVTVIDKGK